MSRRALLLPTLLFSVLVLPAASAGAATKAPVADPTAPPGRTIGPSCAAPTLAQCQDPTYLDTTCGSLNAQACGQLVAPIYQSSVEAVSDTTTILKNNGSFDELVTAKRLTPIAMPERKNTFGTFSFATTVDSDRIHFPYSPVANLTPQHPAYEANGTAVASCQEYAYESLYDQERWVEAAETCGANAECVYQLSLRADTPTLKTTMLKKNGTPMAVQPVRPGAYSNIKNVFFGSLVTSLREHPDYATSSSFRSKAEAIISNVTGTPPTTATSELAWHRSMHDSAATANVALTYVAPAEAASIDDRFAAVDRAESAIGDANFIIPLFEAVIPGQAPDDQVRSQAIVAQYRASKASAIVDLARLMFAEWDHVSALDGYTVDRGCLNRSSKRCDWSPKKFAERYAHQFTAKSQELFDACIQATGNDFTHVPSQYKTSTDALAVWIEARSLPKLGTETVGQRLNDGDEWGDRDWFAAGYGYDAGWQLAAERQPNTQRICKLKGKAYASGNATAWALGQTIPVLDTQHSLSVREVGDAIKIHSHLRFMGEDVYTPVDVNTTLPSATPIDRSYQKTLAEKTYTKWLTIAGVGVKLQAHAELKAGASLQAHATAASGCNPDNLAYDAGISVTPWIDVHVVPEVSVGIGIIQGGIRGNVDLLKVSAPASGSVKLVGGVNDITLQLRAQAEVDLNLLKGNLDVFLESCLPWVGCADLASKQIYAWDGYQWTFPLLSYQKNYSIAIFDAATLPPPPPTLGAGGGMLAGMN